MVNDLVRGGGVKFVSLLSLVTTVIFRLVLIAALNTGQMNSFTLIGQHRQIVTDTGSGRIEITKSPTNYPS